MSNMTTKVAESVSFIDDDTMLIKKTHDANHMLNDVKRSRETAENAFASDYKLVGHVDIALLGVWLKEAGVAWSDTQAVKDVLKRKLMSSEFSALRVWEGAY